MKLKLKMSMLAGALALAAAGQASAQITTGAGFGDQLLLSVWDPIAQTSYTRGLGVTMNDFISAAGMNFGAATDGSGFTATGGSLGYSLAADASLTSYLAASSADASLLQWNVVSGDVNGGMVYGQNGYLTTSNNMQTTNDVAILGMNSYGSYVSTVNSLMPSGSVFGNTDSVTAASPSLAYAGGSFAGNFGGYAPFNTAQNLGVSQSFWLLTPTTGSRGYNGNALAYQFTGNVTLDSAGNLNVAAVPEPGEWALMLSGFGLIGFIALRRKNNSTGMTFA